MHYTPERFYQQIHSRLKALDKKREQRRYCDPRIQPLVDALNACHSVTTVWSCSGHTPAERLAADKETAKRSRGYLIFCVRDSAGDYVLRTISRWISDLSFETYKSHRFNLNMTKLHFGGFTARCTEGTPTEDYPCWCLEAFTECSEEAVTRLGEMFNSLAQALVLATSREA